MRIRTGLLALVAFAALVGGCSDDRDHVQYGPWETLERPYLRGGVASPMPLNADRSDARDADAYPPLASAVAVAFAVLPYGIMLALAVILGLWNGRRALAERACSPTSPLRDGPAVVFGTVEPDPAQTEPFVCVAIRQKGSESQTREGWTHQWTETSRTVRHGPFVIRRDDGVQVRVEPDARTALHDDLSRLERHALDQRTRFAEITAGERVQISGDLTGASDRSPGAMPVLRVPARRPMVISTEAPGALATSLARVHLGWALGLVAAGVFMVAVLAPRYANLARASTVVQARPVATRVWRKIRHHFFVGYEWVPHWSVRAAYDDHGREVLLEDSVGREVFTCVNAGRCPRVPFLVATRDARWHEFGVAPTLTSWEMTCLLGFVWVLFTGYMMSVSLSRPWYADERLFEPGSGPLSASMPFIDEPPQPS